MSDLSAFDLDWRLPRIVSDAGINGGICSATSIAATSSETPWESALPSELEEGSTKYRKGFLRVANADNLPLSKAVRFLERPTPGADQIAICAGTHDDTQADIVGGSPDWYGAGALNAAVLAAATEIEVALEEDSPVIFRDGDLIRISDKATLSATEGHEEWKRIDGAPIVADGVATITLSTGLTYGYSHSNTYVSSCLEDTGIAGAVDDVSVTSVAGTLDDTEIVVGAIGSYYENITLTFTSSTAFTATSDRDGSLGTGSIMGDFAPMNIDKGAPRFTIASAAWGGTFANGDEVQFLVIPPELAHWERRTIPEGCPSLTGNSRRVAIVRR